MQNNNFVSIESILSLRSRDNPQILYLYIFIYVKGRITKTEKSYILIKDKGFQELIKILMTHSLIN